MKNIDEIANATAKDFYFIGDRLQQIRMELIENDPIKDKRLSEFSRKNMAERFKVHYSTITNVERGPISLTTIKLILYYYGLGYNPMWIMSPDNEFINKQNVGENLVYQAEMQDQYKILERGIIASLSEFKEKL